MAIKRAKMAFGYMETNEGRAPTPRVVNPGTLYEDSDPIVSRFPDYFEDVETHVSQRRENQQRNIEAATAAPGERRTRTQPRRSTRTRRQSSEDEAKRAEEERQAEELKAADPDASDDT